MQTAQQKWRMQLRRLMTIEADDARFDDIMKEVVSVCKKVEPDCVILM